MMLRVPVTVFAAGDLPLPTGIPPLIGVTIIALWLAVVWGVIVVLRWRRALREERRPAVSRRPSVGPDRELEPPPRG